MDKCTVIALIEDGVICSCFLDEPCEHALSSCRRYALKDPSALAQMEEDARISRAVREWLDTQTTKRTQRMSDPCGDDWDDGYNSALRDLGKVISKAREATKDV